MTAFAHGREPFPTSSQNKNSPRDGGTSAGPRQGAESLPDPNLQQRAEAAEMVDNGVRLAPVLYGPSIPALAEEPTAVNTELAELTIDDIEAARPYLRQAMKHALHLGDTLAHVAIGEQVNQLDGLKDALKDRWGL